MQGTLTSLPHGYFREAEDRYLIALAGNPDYVPARGGYANKFLSLEDSKMLKKSTGLQ